MQTVSVRTAHRQSRSHHPSAILVSHTERHRQRLWLRVPEDSLIHPSIACRLFQMQTRQSGALIMDLRVPQRVRSAPWCNSLGDAWEYKRQL